MLKVHLKNPEDAILHLQESEKLLRSVKVDEALVSEPLLKASLERI